MRIWIINQYAIPPTQAGGTWHYAMAKELGRRGHGVTIIAGSLDHGSGKQYACSSRRGWQRDLVDGVDFLWLRVPTHRGNSLGRIWNMLVFATRVRFGRGIRSIEKPDVIVATIPTPFAAFASLRMARRYKTPLILDIRDLWPGQTADLARQSFRTVERLAAWPPIVKCLEALEKHLYRRADWVVTVIPRAGEYIATRGAERKRITWLPQVVDFQSAPLPSRGSDSPVFTLIYSGTLSPTYDLDAVLTAAGMLEKRQGSGCTIRFRLIGSGSVKERERLLKRIADEGLTSVHIEPSVPKSRIYRVLETADAFLAPALPSSMHRFGVSFQKAIDYMACARPTVIVTNQRANPISDSQAGLRVNPGDPDALASAILELVRMPLSERVNMGLRGRAVAESVHDASTVAAALERVLVQVTRL
jgi:glycosyltransferase involved in cell wall biosynthesis